MYDGKGERRVSEQYQQSQIQTKKEAIAGFHEEL